MQEESADFPFLLGRGDKPRLEDVSLSQSKGTLSSREMGRRRRRPTVLT